MIAAGTCWRRSNTLAFETLTQASTTNASIHNQEYTCAVGTLVRVDTDVCMSISSIARTIAHVHVPGAGGAGICSRTVLEHALMSGGEVIVHETNDHTHVWSRGSDACRQRNLVSHFCALQTGQQRGLARALYAP
jgi:hypothetical protein